ncbi:MAG: hypothetical protein WCG25_01990 [bacterium]
MCISIFSLKLVNISQELYHHFSSYSNSLFILFSFADLFILLLTTT